MGTLSQIVAGRHEYTLRAGQRTLYLFFAVVCGAMAALFYLMGEGDLHPSTPLFAATAAAAASLYMALVALRSRLIIDGTQVRIQGAIRTRDFDVSDVEGFRTYKSRYQTYRVLCLKDRAWKIPLMKYAGDSTLDNWFAGLKDLDQRDRDQLLEKIDQDQQLGATPEERRKALTSAKQIAIATWIVDGIAAAAFAWGPAQFRLVAMVVLALVPAAAAYLLYQQPLLYGLFKPRKDPRPDLSPALMISVFGLLLGASRVNFISMNLLLPFIVLGALALLTLFYPVARKSPRLAGTMMGLLFLSAFFGWGLAASIDATADPSAPQSYSVQVIGRHISRGSRSTSYFLELEPWGPYQAATTSQMKVSWQMYATTHPGDIVCLALHSGALHAPWYEPVPCDGAAPQPAQP